MSKTPATATANAYDELPYRSLPIEWSAPERLALCSLLHGGPRPALDRYDVLELGCGNGANLLALAYYRRHAQFVGVDGSRSAIAAAEARRRELGLANLRFVHADFETAARELPGRFHFVLMHGVFSWVAEPLRDRLLHLCADKLAPSGLLYLNYNAKPGWNVRGMVRDFLLAQTRDCEDLPARVRLAHELAASAARAFEGVEHPFAQLMEREFRFVCEGHPSYVAHEFLAPENHAYWRSEFSALAHSAGLRYVADADFNHDAGRVPEDAEQRIAQAGFRAPWQDTADLFAYRQLHSPLLTSAGTASGAPTAGELARLFMASSLARLPPEQDAPPRFRHPGGFEVEARSAAMCSALETLARCHPHALAVAALFEDVPAAADDLQLLYRHGMIDLRLVVPGSEPTADALHACERRWGGYCTDAYHRVQLFDV